MTVLKKTSYPSSSYSYFFLILFVLGLIPVALFAQSEAGQIANRRAQLEQNLVELERQIDVQRDIVEVKQKQTQSLERDVDILNAEIRKSELSIQARNISISNLTRDIGGKESTINSLTAKVRREKTSLAQLLRKRDEIDSLSLVEMILGNKNLSEFFEDLDAFSQVEEALQASFIEIADTKVQTRKQKESLEGTRVDERALRNIQQFEKGRIEVKKEEKNEILDVSKGQEELYQKILRSQERSATQIRAELFTLRGSAAIPFGKALELANNAAKLANIRPALILGVIAEESNLGENVGTGNWRTDMHPERDRPPFQLITAELGLDPDLMPVSKKPWYGWGGAMGPAQFIPSTWILYKDQVGKLTGNKPPNPWDPLDAFTASAILLRDNGADKGGYANERLAALRYFAGWKNATKSSYAFYGDEVMGLTAKYQKQIDILERN